MDAGFLIAQALAGLASAAQLFLIASGLTLIFGVTRIVNFAHGSLYMIGAYVAVTVANAVIWSWPYPALGFWTAVLAGVAAAALFGVLMELLILRRIYRAPEIFQLLATFAIVLIVQDGILLIFGPQDQLGPRAPGLDRALPLLGQYIPEWDLLLIAIGAAVLLLLKLVFHRTRWGVLVRAATEDREMVSALGVGQSWLFTSVVALGAALAGLAGALEMPREPAVPFMDLQVIVQAFVVTVIGGMGSLSGAFIAALIIGLLQSFGILLLPRITIVLIFLVMAVVLVLRPYGLLGRAPAGRERPTPAAPLRAWPARTRWLLMALAAVLLAGLPLILDEYLILIATEMLIMALFAMSLGFLMGHGGVISFGHAAYFGLGAYGAALLVRHFSLPMELSLLAAPVTAAAGALVFGWFCVRLTGVYAAMLTLAFAQIVWSIAFQWYEVTGGDNGLIGIWPSQWASARMAYYYLTLVLAGAAMLMLRRILFAPFGLTMRAVRDDAERADAIGIDPVRHRWLVFMIAGAAAGLAGGLFAFSKGSIDPTILGIPTSVDALAMMLLGGLETVVGPAIGAALLTGLKAYVMPLTDQWRLVLGGMILLLVLAFPGGIAGAVGRLRRRGR